MNKNYYRILWGCLAVVVIAGGIYYFAGRDKTPVPSTTTPQQTEQAAHQVIVNQTPALQEAVEGNINTIVLNNKKQKLFQHNNNSL